MRLGKCLVFAVLVLVSSVSGAMDADQRIEQLIQASAKTPVISMNNEDFLKFAGGNSRPYSLIVFCNAVTVREAKSVKLHEYLKNMAVVAKQARAHARKQGPEDPANKLFFVEIDMAHSRDVFMALGVQNLPWALHIAPDTRRERSNGKWDISARDMMTPSSHGRDVWTASAFAGFVKERTKIDIGTVHEPSVFRDPFFVGTLLALLIPTIYGAWKVYTSSWIGSPWIWTTFVLAVFMFATSGGLHNIIRNVPLVRLGQHGVEWYVQSPGQLGAEGFVVGGMYVMFALCCCGLIYANDLFDHPGAVRVSSYIFIAGAVILFLRIKAFYAWKTGYHLRFYLFEVLMKNL